jgi:nucleoside-diphosphate-sugar epimerase
MTKRILLTGATGFLGRNLHRTLLEKGCDVIVFRSGMALERVDIVIHCATRYKGELSELVEANLQLPFSLLELSPDYFINIDTTLPVSVNAYSDSKAFVRKWGRELFPSVNFVNIRLEHMYGPDDSPSRFPMRVMQHCISARGAMDLTKGEQKRDFIFIDDVVEALCLILEKLQEGKSVAQEYALGSGSAVSIREFVLKIRELLSSDAEFNFGVVPYREAEQMFSQADITALMQLGWEPKVSLEDGLKRLINHLRVEVR